MMCYILQDVAKDVSAQEIIAREVTQFMTTAGSVRVSSCAAWLVVLASSSDRSLLTVQQGQYRRSHHPALPTAFSTMYAPFIVQATMLHTEDLQSS